MNPHFERRLKLMAYADGELSDAEREEVESWLREDGNAGRFTRELAELGSLVRLGHEQSRDARAIAAFDGVDGIMAKVDAERSSEKGNAGGREPAVIDLTARAPRQKIFKIGGAVAAALALAASVVVMTRHKEEQPMALSPVPGVEVVSSSGGVDVDVVQTPGQSVAVYVLPNETSLTTSVVVWVDETGAK